MEKPVFVALDFQPDAALVSVVRRFVSDLFNRFLVDPETTSRVALATHELLENAVKYTVGAATVSIQITRSAPRQSVSIRTTNQASEADVARLRAIAKELAEHADPIEYYQKVLRRTLGASGSGLGLARIRAESDMTIDVQVDQDRVTICAEFLP